MESLSNTYALIMQLKKLHLYLVRQAFPHFQHVSVNEPTFVFTKVNTRRTIVNPYSMSMTSIFSSDLFASFPTKTQTSNVTIWAIVTVNLGIARNLLTPRADCCAKNVVRTCLQKMKLKKVLSHSINSTNIVMQIDTNQIMKPASRCSMVSCSGSVLDELSVFMVRKKPFDFCKKCSIKPPERSCCIFWSKMLNSLWLRGNSKPLISKFSLSLKTLLRYSFFVISEISINKWGAICATPLKEESKIFCSLISMNSSTVSCSMMRALRIKSRIKIWSLNSIKSYFLTNSISLKWCENPGCM